MITGVAESVAVADASLTHVHAAESTGFVQMRAGSFEQLPSFAKQLLEPSTLLSTF
jgi:hypothetical protein